MDYTYSAPNPQEQTGAKLATIMMESYESQQQYREAYAGEAAIELSDKDAPSITHTATPGGWVNEKAGEPLAVTAVDTGLGVKEVVAKLPNSFQVAAQKGCSGIASNPCPREWNSSKGGVPPVNYEPKLMPQGQDWVQLEAVDPIGHRSPEEGHGPSEVKVKVDHTAPTLALSGTLTEQAKLGTNLPQYTLKYGATDGDGAAASALPQFSSAGTGEGKLERPLGTAVDKEGNVWVVDRTNRRVEEFSESGQFLRQFGKAGSGNGEFMDPCGIAISSNGNIVVSDMTNNNVQAFTPTGQFIRTITYSGFIDPYAIAPASGGALWVGDDAAHHVFEFSETGTLLKTLGEPSHNGGPLNVPSGLATDAAGNLWVSDTAENWIRKYSPSGEFIMQFGTTGTGNGQFVNPTSIAVAPSGNLMVSDANNNRLEEFQPNGAYLRKFGSLGTGLGQVTEERGLAFGPGNVLYVADAGNHRVDRWSHADLDNQSGVVSTEVKVDGNLVEPAYAPGCSIENCSINNREWMLESSNYTAGQHKLEVVATDGVGLHSPPNPVTFEVHPAPPSLALAGSMIEQAALGNTRPRYTLQAEAGPNGQSSESPAPPSSPPSAPPARAPAS